MINFINVASPESGIWYVGKRYYEYMSKYTMTQWHSLRWDNDYTYNMFKNLFFPETMKDGIVILGDNRLTPINADNQVVVMHDFFKDSFLPNRIKRELNNGIMQAYKTKVIAVSDYTAELSKQRGLNVIGTLYPFYSVGYFDNSKKYNSVLSIGSNAPRKRNDIITDFINKLPDNFYAVRIGSPLPKQINLNYKYYYANKISESAIRTFYASSKYLIFPSEDEGLGLPMIEALFHNMVVIANAKNPVLKEFNYPKIIVPMKEGDFYIPDYPDINEFERFRFNYITAIGKQFSAIKEKIGIC